MWLDVLTVGTTATLKLQMLGYLKYHQPGNVLHSKPAKINTLFIYVCIDLLVANMCQPFNADLQTCVAEWGRKNHGRDAACMVYKYWWCPKAITVTGQLPNLASWCPSDQGPDWLSLSKEYCESSHPKYCVAWPEKKRLVFFGSWMGRIFGDFFGMSENYGTSTLEMISWSRKSMGFTDPCFEAHTHRRDHMFIIS